MLGAELTTNELVSVKCEKENKCEVILSKRAEIFVDLKVHFFF